jgi:putative transposase
MENQVKELERKITAVRKSEHGNLVNRILSYGTTIQTEKLSYLAFQKLFGRSVKQRSPGMFISLLKRRAENAGGKVVELNTWTLKMSQYNHLSDEYIKKPLSQRFQVLGESIVDRDIYSAFLACFVKDNTHNRNHLLERWTTVEPQLKRIGLCRTLTDEGKSFRFPTVSLPSESVVRRKDFN